MNSEWDCTLLRTSATPFKAPDEDAETTVHLKLSDLHCSDELMSKFKVGGLFNFHVFLWQISETAVEGNSLCKLVWNKLIEEGITYIHTSAFQSIHVRAFSSTEYKTCQEYNH
jgi:hypothetical protein